MNSDRIRDLWRHAGDYGASAGGIQARGTTPAKARENAVHRALVAVESIDRARPRMVSHAGMVSMVFPTLDCCGGIHWNYTYPRTPAEINDNIGHSGCYDSAGEAVSNALYHMAQNAMDGIVPEGMTRKDEDALRHYFTAAGLTSAAATA